MPLISSYPILSTPATDDLIPIVDVSDLNPTTSNPKLKNTTVATLASVVSEEVSPLDAQGDIWTYSTVNAKLTRGNNGQILSSNSNTLTGLEWISPPSLGSAAYLNAGTTAIPNNLVQLDGSGKLPKLDGSALTGISTGLTSKLTTPGDLWTYTATDADTRLPHGNPGEVLTSTSTGIEWSAISQGITSPLAQNGDIWYYNGVDTALAKATNPYSVLTSRSFEEMPSWRLDPGVFVEYKNTGWSLSGSSDSGKLFIVDTSAGDVVVTTGAGVASLAYALNFYFYNNGPNRIIFSGSGWTFPFGDIIHSNGFARAINTGNYELSLIVFGPKSPLENKGDLWTYSTTNAKLEHGNEGYILSSNSNTLTGLEWIPLPSSLPYQNFTTPRTTSFSLLEGNHGSWIPCTNTLGLIVTLPVDFPDGFQCIVDRQGTGSVSFEGAIGTTVVANSTDIIAQYGVVHAVVNNNVWRLTGAL